MRALSGRYKKDLTKTKAAEYNLVDYVLNNVKTLTPTKREIKEAMKIISARTMGRGEAESIGIAKSRKMLLLTNDKIAAKESRKARVDSMNLPMIIRQYKI